MKSTSTFVFIASALLVACMSLLAHAQIATKEFTTRPVASYTFDRDPSQTIVGGFPQSRGSSFEWSAGAGSHTGIVSFDGFQDFIDLNYFTDDDGKNMTSMLLGQDMAIEIWASWTGMNYWSRLFDFGGPIGLNDDNIFLANGWDASLLVFETYNGTDNTDSIIWYDGGVNIYNWQHVVTTVSRNPSATRPNNAAILTLYLNGVAVSSTTGYLPKVMRRPKSWIGRSNWEAWGDSRYRGLFDDVFIYNYSLSAEAVAAHYLVPRVALFELTFSTDPRINMNMLGNSQTTYSWQPLDTADSSSNQLAHRGHLVLADNQFLDVSVDEGFSAVGTDLPAIGDNGWFAADNDTIGWTFETTIKFTEVTPNACVFDFFAGTSNAPTDRIAMCFSQTGSSILLTVSNSRINNGLAMAWDVLQSPAANRWYHIAVNVQPLDVGSNVGRYEAFVDGSYTFSTNNGAWLARPSTARTTYIGRSFNNVYLKAYIDSFRVYDYALTPSEVRSLYRTVSGLPISSQPSLYTTGPSVSHTFDVDIPWGQRNGGTRLDWVDTMAGRAGVVRLITADTQFINLLTLPDRDLKLFPGFIGGRSMSFEFWVMFTGFTNWQRLLDLSGADWGVGAFMDNIFIATLRSDNAFSSATMVFAVTAGTTGSEDSRIIVPNAVVLNTWYHIVATIKVDKTINGTLPNSAQLQLYLNGVPIGAVNSRTPRFLNRPNSWIGRSRYGQDAYLAAFIDAFHYYDYPLELEQAIAHSCVARPPMFELTFSSVPSSLPLMNNTYNFGWLAADPSSTPQGQRNHPNVLSLNAALQQYVDLNVITGPASIGTVLPMLATLRDSNTLSSTFEFLPGTANQRYGMTLEFAFRYNSAMGANAKLFSCGSTATANLIEVAFQPITRDLTFYVHNTEVSLSYSVTIYTALQSSRWYHITLALRPYNARYGASFVAYIDGQVVVRRQFGALFPYAIPRDLCYLGRGASAAADTYFDGVIDAFRAYDYVLNGTEVSALFNRTSKEADPNLTPIIGIADGSTGGVVAPPAAASSSSSLSGGAVAGIVIACVVGVILFGIVGLWYARSGKASNTTSRGGKASPHVELSEISEVRDESGHEETA